MGSSDTLLMERFRTELLITLVDATERGVCGELRPFVEYDEPLHFPE